MWSDEWSGLPLTSEHPTQSGQVNQPIFTQGGVMCVGPWGGGGVGLHGATWHPQASEEDATAKAPSQVARQEPTGLGAVLAGGAGSAWPPRPGMPHRARLPRTKFTSAQLLLLEDAFAKCRYPDCLARQQLCAEARLPPGKVQIWFQNRRAKFRKQAKRMERLSERLETLGRAPCQPPQAPDLPAQPPAFPQTSQPSHSLPSSCAQAAQPSYAVPSQQPWTQAPSDAVVWVSQEPSPAHPPHQVLTSAHQL